MKADNYIGGVTVETTCITVGDIRAAIANIADDTKIISNDESFCTLFYVIPFQQYYADATRNIPVMDSRLILA